MRFTHTTLNCTVALKSLLQGTSETCATACSDPHPNEQFARMTHSSPACTSFYVFFPCWHFPFGAQYGEAVGKLEVMVSRTVALAPALGALSGLPCAGDQYEPWYGSFSVLGKSTAVDRETDGKGEQTVISVFGSHSRVFPPLSEMSLIFWSISESKWDQRPEQSYWETPEKWCPHGKPRRKHPLLKQDCLPLLCCHPGHISLITSFLADFSEQEAIYLSSWRQRRPSGKELEWREEGLLCKAMRHSLGTLASHKADHTRGLANFWMHDWMHFGSLLSLERPRGDWHLVFYTRYLMSSPVPRWLCRKDEGSLLVDGWTSLVAFLVGISMDWILRFSCQLN